MDGIADTKPRLHNTNRENTKMRDIDRRTTISRRGFMKTTAAAPAAATIAAGVGISANAAWAQGAQNLSPHVTATLVKAARDIFPHDMLADKYYVTACAGYEELAKDTAKKALLEGGVARLDADAKDRFGAAGYMSVNSMFPHGLANSSGQVGRNYMRHMTASV
jgi:secreted PhoX family phosphatase